MYSELIKFAFWFGIGIFLSAARKIKTKASLLTLAFCVGVSLFLFLPGKKEYSYDLFMHVITFYFFFTYLFTVLAAKEILEKIDENSILIYTFLYWYSFFTNYYLFPTFILNTLFAFGIVGSILVIYISFKETQNSLIVKLATYLWFILLNLLLLIFQYTSGKIVFPNKEIVLTNNNPVFLIINGMAFFQLVTNLTVVFELIPLPSKHQTLASRIKQLKNYINLLSEKVSDNQLHKTKTIAIFTTIAFILLINYLFNFVPNSVAINLCLVFTSLEVWKVFFKDEKTQRV